MMRNLVLLFCLAGCASQTKTEIEWSHDDPNANFTSDEYECENIALERQKNIGLCVACGLNDAVDDCLIRLKGWTRIRRIVEK